MVGVSVAFETPWSQQVASLLLPVAGGMSGATAAYHERTYDA